MDALLDPAAADPSASPSHAPDGDRRARLFSGLSHEICRPLIAMRVGCDLLLAGCEGPINTDQQEHLGRLRAHCDDFLRLTRTYLLDYADLARSRPPIDWAAYRLGALIDEADRQFADAARARSVLWSCRLDEVDATVETDLARFQRVLTRLVENAVGHTPPGATIGVLARAEGDHWSVSVVDDGGGIPTESIGRVLEPLVRLPALGCVRTGGHGLGLGLSVCRELVGQLHGEFTLVSNPGEGTMATVRFPVRRPG